MFLVALSLGSLVSQPSIARADDPIDASPPVGSIPVETRIAACPSPPRPTHAALVDYGEIVASQAQKYLHGRPPAPAWRPVISRLPASTPLTPLVAPLRLRAWVLERLRSRDGRDLLVAASTLRTFAPTFRQDVALLATALQRANAGGSDEVPVMLAAVASIHPDGLIDLLRPSLRSPSSQVVHAALFEVSALDVATPGTYEAVARELADLVVSARPLALRTRALSAWLGLPIVKLRGSAHCGHARHHGCGGLMGLRSSMQPEITYTSAGERLPRAASEWIARAEVPHALDDSEDPCEVVTLPIRSEDDQTSSLHLQAATETRDGWWVSYRVDSSPGRVDFVEGPKLALPPWGEDTLPIDVYAFADTRLGMLAFANDDCSTATTIHRLEIVDGGLRATPLLSMAESVSASWVFDGGRVFLRLGADVVEMTGPAEAVTLTRITAPTTTPTTTPSTVVVNDPRGTRGERR